MKTWQAIYRCTTMTTCYMIHFWLIWFGVVLFETIENQLVSPSFPDILVIIHVLINKQCIFHNHCTNMSQGAFCARGQYHWSGLWSLRSPSLIFERSQWLYGNQALENFLSWRSRSPHALRSLRSLTSRFPYDCCDPWVNFFERL